VGKGGVLTFTLLLTSLAETFPRPMMHASRTPEKREISRAVPEKKKANSDFNFDSGIR